MSLVAASRWACAIALLAATAAWADDARPPVAPVSIAIGTSGYRCVVSEKRIVHGSVPGRLEAASRARAQQGPGRQERELRRQIGRIRGGQPLSRLAAPKQAAVLLLLDQARNASRTVRDLGRCVQGQLDRLDSRGVPSRKVPWTVGVEIGYQGPSEKTAAEAFAYDTDTYFVRSASLHGTTVTVAIHNRAIATVRARHTPAQYADAVIAQFHEAWHVFGGFTLDGYVFKVNSPAERTGLVLSQGGVALDATEYANLGNSHEIIHSWNGKTMFYEPNGSDNLFQLETWVNEGATVFLSYRIDGMLFGAEHYDAAQKGLWGEYTSKLGTKYDRSYAQLAVEASPTGVSNGTDWNWMLGARGNHLVYLLDRELVRRGSSIDAVLRRLYRSHGLSDRRYTQAGVMSIVRSALGAGRAAWFEQRLLTNARLTPELGPTRELTPDDPNPLLFLHH